MTSRSRTRRHRSTPQIAPRTNFFPSFLELARTTLTTRLSHSPVPLTSKKLAPLLSMLEQVDAAGIPNCGFVFPRRYLLFHAGVHGMNEEGKLEGWTDDDSPFSPLFLPFSPPPFLFFNFSSLLFFSSPSIPFECFLSSVEARWWMVIGIKLCRC